MGALENLVLAPLPEQIPLVRMLIVLLVIVFLSFAGLRIVAAAGALIAGFWRPVVAERLRLLLARGVAVWIIFGILPLATLVFLWGAALHGTRIAITLYMVRVSLLALAGLAALYLYTRRGHPLAGLAGVLLLLGAVYHFVATLTLVTFPEKWGFIATPLPFLYSIQAIIQFNLVMACATLLTGALLVLIHCAWPERESFADPADETALRRVGGGLILAGALGMAPLLVWDLYSAPAQSLTLHVFAVVLVMFAGLFAAATLTLAMLLRASVRHAGVTAFLALLLMALLAYRGEAARAIATQEVGRSLLAAAEARYDSLLALQESHYVSEPPSEELGQRLFEERCSACHDFDRKIVGPPYNEVLRKYGDNLVALADFILAPRRVDPAYPAMPNQGLRPFEAQSAAIYLMKRVTGSADPSVFEEEGAAGERRGTGAEHAPAPESPAEEGRP